MARKRVVEEPALKETPERPDTLHCRRSPGASQVRGGGNTVLSPQVRDFIYLSAALLVCHFIAQKRLSKK